MSALASKFRVAIFDQFLESFANIPKAQQKKVNKFVRRFRADPTAASINYEKIKSFVDQNLRTVRIDDAYRAVVLKPDTGNVYVLLWVDHHDKAMQWAENKRVSIHPETGTLQVLTTAASPLTPVDPTPLPKRPKKPAKPVPPLFAPWNDQDLIGLGLPQARLADVREVTTLEELEALHSFLPAEAYESLLWLAEGETLQDVREVLGLDTPKKEPVDTTNFAAALENEATQRSFVIVEDDAELSAMLDAPLEKWRVFLHPSQRKLVQGDFKGPTRVLGGAGTGKTVVAMHRAVHLAQKHFNAPEDRLLFTTFTKNLAADIASNLRKICPAEAYRRIEVVHLDKWVSNFLNREGYQYQIDYFRSDGRLGKLWLQALELAPQGEFPDSFYREEWEFVVQSQGCQDLDAYCKARRTGRGVRLNRRQRKQAWPVFEEYRNLLEENKLKESVDAMRDAANLLQERKAVVNYKAILVDEAQDMSTTAFTLIRQMIPEERANDLFIVGDGHQRIYRRRVTLSHAGINIRGRRGRHLRINYRTTEEIRRYALSKLRGVEIDDLDGGKDTPKGYKSLIHGQAPQVKRCKTFEEEIDAIAAYVKAGEPNKTCLVARTSNLLDQYKAALKEKGIEETYEIRRSQAEDHTAPGLRLATMHRIKGLEFDRMIVAGVVEGTIPLRQAMAESTDEAVRQETELHERALLYVALTRAKKDALLTSHGTPSPWISEE